MGKNVLIIGASGDIGTEIAEKLAGNGWQLILHYNKNKQAMEANRMHLNRESVLMEIQADLSEQSGINHLLGQLVFPADAIVFAGGIAQYGMLHAPVEQIMDDLMNY